MKQILAISIFILSSWVQVHGQSTLDTLNLAIGDSLIVEVESRGCGFNKTINARKYLIYMDPKSGIHLDVISYKYDTYSLEEFDGISRKSRKLNEAFLAEKNVSLNTEISFDSISLSELFIGWDEDILEDSVQAKLERGDYKYTTLGCSVTYSESIDASYLLSDDSFDSLKTFCSVALKNDNKTKPSGGSLFRYYVVRIVHSKSDTRELIGKNYFYDSFLILSVVE